MWLFADALKAYRNVNSALPERLVIYRDGVGDGQLKAVHEQEVIQMQEIFEAASPGYKWAIVANNLCSDSDIKVDSNVIFLKD